MAILKKDGNRLMIRNDTEQVWIEPWGKNSFRVRATHMLEMPADDWALLPVPAVETEIEIGENGARIRNGKIVAKVSKVGLITLEDADGKLLLKERWRTRTKGFETISALEIKGRDFVPHRGGDYELHMRFEPNPDEHIFGMGQYQDGLIDKMGCTLELAHRNSQASVPFYISTNGYGFLWNNPSIGRVTFSRNITEWVASSTKTLDYWITVGDTPADIMSAYADATGHAPMMPDYGMGYWQCKLRYQTQDELMEVARKHKSLGLPMDVIVSDFFHWPMQGDWRFDESEWPDPDAMVKELEEMGIKLMVSVWPYVDTRSENYREMLENGYLIRTERGVRIAMTFCGETVPFDPTNPEARKYVWSIIKKNYFDKGIQIFWLDEAEPEYAVYDFDNYRYAMGSDLAVGNIFPLVYAQTFYEGMQAEGMENPLNLLRCAWAGSQRYGALVWSGDTDTTFRSFREQFTSGLSMAMSGIPWWTSDIGGFDGGDQNDPAFRELLVRWFQFGLFCPVFRLHGDRKNGKPSGITSKAHTGGPNEVWSYGEEVYEILKKYLFLREEMRPYTAATMKKTAETGAPVIRPLYYDFPCDAKTIGVEDQMMYGDDVLVCPVFELGQRQREVYLPAGETWIDAHTGEEYAGGQTILADAPLERCPVYLKKSGALRFTI
ncbi:MAG: glycoside hydrolase family 31 protein [Ruminococcaceae bacterium]|nr:glycoside hydrolase family 31 protein [Oscillospiraceae bacterium]